jgi:hypothetical protein
MSQPGTPSVLGTAGILAQPLSVTLGEAVGLLLLLLLSLTLNALQLYQRWVHIRTVYNQLIGIFNSIGWGLVRCMSRTEELENRTKTSDRYVAESGILRDFRNYSLETEFLLHILHEQLVSMAKILSANRRWRYSQEEKERMEERYGAKLKRVD